MFSQYKKIIIAVIVLVLAFIGYSFFKDEIFDSGESLNVQAQTPTDVLGRDIISVLNRIGAIKLDRSLFSDKIYNYLTDHSENLGSQPAGRENIFAPYSQLSIPTESSQNNK